MARSSFLKSMPMLALGVASTLFAWQQAMGAQEKNTAAASVAPAVAPVASSTSSAPSVVAPMAATESTKAPGTPQSALATFVNQYAPRGWEPLPFYMWTWAPGPPPPVAPAAAPVSGAVAPPGATASSSGGTPVSPTGFVAAAPGTAAAATNTAPVQPAVPQSLRGPSPQLPDGDVAREAILGEYGLAGFFRKTFKRGQRYIYIDIYDFQNAEGAYGAYNYLRKGSTTVLPRGDVGSEDDDSISFVQGKTFLSIYGTSHDDDESKELQSKIAAQAVNYMGERTGQPRILYRLPAIEIVHGSEKIVMGPNSVRRFFPAPYVNSLVLDNGRAVGCVADYQMQEPVKERVKLLILVFKNPADATSSYQNFLTQAAAARGADAAAMLAQPINVLKMGSTFLGIEKKGSDLLMVTGARKRFSPAMLMRLVY